MSYLSICKNIIASNNKKNWVNPDPAIRISKSASGKAIARSNRVEIVDADGNTVAVVLSTEDGKPILKCGAKVAILTAYPVKID